MGLLAFGVEATEIDVVKKKNSNKGEEVKTKAVVAPCSTDWNANPAKQTITISSAVAQGGGTITNLLDGTGGGQNAYYTANNQAINNIEVFKFGFPTPVILQGLESADGTFLDNNSTYRIEASNDNSTWVDLTGELTHSSSRTASTISTGETTHKYPITGNSNAYSYYRILGSSSGNTNWDWFSEFYFDYIDPTPGLSNVSANYGVDINTTTDDQITFDLDPSGGTGTYNVTVSSGSVSPTSGTFGTPTSFVLQPGSAGAGDVTLTVVNVGGACDLIDIITDPGTTPYNDNDNDGVGDLVDKDDDNDGILDVIEDNICGEGPIDYNEQVNKDNIILTTTAPWSGSAQTLLDGNLTDQNLFMSNSGLAGAEIVRLQFPSATVLTGIEYYIGDSRMLDNGTNTVIEGSNDGNTWMTMSPPAEYTHASPNNTPGVISSAPYAHVYLWENTTPYIYYRHRATNGGGNTNPWVYELYFQTSDVAPCDWDKDGVVNSWDLDADNDGIPDNIEGQATASYAAPNADSPMTYANNQGVNSAYLGGLPAPDTDSDDLPDFIDTDSDGDRKPDSEESGLSLAGNYSAGNGMDNNIKTTDDYTDVNGSVNNPATNLAAVTTLNAPEVDYRDKEPPPTVRVCYNPETYGMGGGQGSHADDKITNLVNFGPDGIGYVNFIAVSMGTGTNAYTAATLASNQCDIVYLGGNNSDAGTMNSGSSTLSASELEAIRIWAQSPSHVLIAFQGHANYMGGDGTTTEFVGDGTNSNPNSLTSLGDIVVSGDFGSPTGFNQGGGFQGRFTAFPSTACAITQDANGNPTGLLNGLTGDFYLADYGLVGNLGGLTENNGISSNTDIFFANLMASAARVVVEGPNNVCAFFSCPAGDDAPILTNNSVQGLGQPVDLTPQFTGTPPAETRLTWHNAQPVSDSNFVANANSYPKTDTLYAAFRANDGSCYSPSTPIAILVQSPDLEVSVSPSTLTTAASEVQEFVVTVTNNGPINAPLATVRVPIPSSRSIVLATTSVGDYDRSLGLWSIPNLASAASATLTLTLRVQ